jgi:hypothetical protein
MRSATWTKLVKSLCTNIGSGRIRDARWVRVVLPKHLARGRPRGVPVDDARESATVMLAAQLKDGGAESDPCLPQRRQHRAGMFRRAVLSLRSLPFLQGRLRKRDTLGPVHGWKLACEAKRLRLEQLPRLQLFGCSGRTSPEVIDLGLLNCGDQRPDARVLHDDAAEHLVRRLVVILTALVDEEDSP